MNNSLYDWGVVMRILHEATDEVVMRINARDTIVQRLYKTPFDGESPLIHARFLLLQAIELTMY